MAGYLSTSIGKKQLVAVTGLAMVGFLIAHLLGNLLLFAGPEALNQYSKTLHDLGGVLWVARIGLLASFVIHFSLVFSLIMKNKKARQQDYAQPLHKKTRSLFAKTMRYSGLIIFVYIGVHLFDYTFTAHTMENSVVNGEYLGLYGHLYNSFLNPIRSAFYIITMICIGMHLVHGVHSVLQTFGVNHPVFTPLAKRTSWLVATCLTLGFSAIPIYVMIHNQCNWSL